MLKNEIEKKNNTKKPQLELTDQTRDLSYEAKITSWKENQNKL